MMPQGVSRSRVAPAYKYPTASVDRLLALLRRAEIAAERWFDRELWPWLEATMLEHSRVGYWFRLWVAGLLTLVVVSQFVIWYQRVFLGRGI